MLLAIHGATGGWDELAIAVVALAVLWVAVKLAGRKPADEDDEDDAGLLGEPVVGVDERGKKPVPPATPLG